MKIKNIALCSVALLGISAAAQADNFEVTLNTSSITGTSGYIDFGLYPGGQSTQLVDASVSGFNSDGSFPANGQTLNLGGAGGASGGPIATAPVSIVSSYADNDDQEAFTFGTYLSFDVTLSGPAIDSPDGTAGSPTTFDFEVYDSNFNPLLTSDPNGVVGAITVNPDGSIATSNVSADANVQATPEPATFLLIGGALCAVGSLKKFRSRR